MPHTSYNIMSGQDCRNKCVFSFRRNTSKDGADVMSSGRVFQSLGPATANERSPTVTSRDRGMTSSEEVHALPITQPTECMWLSLSNDRFIGKCPCRECIMQLSSSLMLLSTGYQEKIPFVKSAPIEADDTSKSKKKQSAGGAAGASGGGKKGTRVNTAEHPAGDMPNAVVDGIDNVTLQS